MSLAYSAKYLSHKTEGLPLILSQRKIEILERHLASRKEVQEIVPEYLYTLTGGQANWSLSVNKNIYLV